MKIESFKICTNINSFRKKNLHKEMNKHDYFHFLYDGKMKYNNVILSCFVERETVRLKSSLRNRVK